MKAVEKDRYPDLVSGIRVVVDIFIDVLLRLVRNRKFSAYVHPVVPVLDPTRHIVKAFNPVLKAAVDAEPMLHWVDYFDDLLDPSGNALRKEFELDGTHVRAVFVYTF